MQRIWTAFRAFFRVMFNGQVATQVAGVLNRRDLPAPEAAVETPPAEPKKMTKPKLPARSDAVTLLATLQREARFIDFLQEPLAGYSDAQIGAVARDVHRDCGAVVQRLFAVQAVVDQEEGSPIEVPEGFDAGRYRLTGNVVGQPPLRGVLMHHGWQATQCEMPAWTGSEESARIVAPVEVELK